MTLGVLAPTRPQAPPSLQALAINFLHMPQLQAHWARLHLSAVERLRDSNGNDVSSLPPSCQHASMLSPARRRLQALRLSRVGTSRKAFLSPPPSSPSSPSSSHRQSTSPLSLPWAISFLSPTPWKSLVRPLSLSGGGIIRSWRRLIYPKQRCRRPGFEKVSPFVVPPHPILAALSRPGER